MGRTTRNSQNVPTNTPTDSPNDITKLPLRPYCIRRWWGRMFRFESDFRPGGLRGILRPNEDCFILS